MANHLLQVLDLIEAGQLSYLRRFVLLYKFDLNQIGTESGIGAIHYASGLEDETRAMDTCQLLIELGAQVNTRTCYDKVTPLHIAVEKGFASLLELLLVNGGDLEARNIEGDTPIALAIVSKNEVVIEKIVEHVKRKKQNSRLDALRASEALLTPTKRGKAPNPAQLVNSPYYVEVKRKSRTMMVVQEVIEISDESEAEEEDDETQYFTPVERSSVNLFELTKENLEEFTRSNRVRNTQRRSLVSRWCDNIRRSDRPVTMIDNIKRMAKLFTGYEDDTTIQEEGDEEEEEEESDRVADPPPPPVANNISNRDSEVPQEFIDLCVADEDEGGTHDEVAAAVASRGIPNIIITSPDTSMERSLPREIRDQFPTSDLSRSPPEYQLWSDEEEQVRIQRAVQEAEVPVIEISESNGQSEGDATTEEGEERLVGETSAVNQSHFDESNFIKSPKPVDDNSIEQLVEEYEHRDIECGLKFLELKLVANNHRYSSQSVTKLINMVGKEGGGDAKKGLRSGSPNSTMSSIISTAISVPLDYDTDALRDELKSFGCNPGPITMTTKRLYLRRLFRYKKDPRRVPENQFDSAVQYFSLELQQTLKPNLKESVIQDFAKLEQQMELSFRGESKQWRQGNAKKSFIYMLIDPRISQNLPGVAADMQPHEIWRQFLASVFYVGKGKSSRPYAHLYEAMEMSRVREAPLPKKVKDRAKVERIMDIWRCESGVVCLQVFHNIIPAEAFTREGAIIEALGVRSLTNLKAGEFYGVVQGWPQKRKKQLGIFLLFKALRMFLLEGESQISPVDL